MQTNVHAKSSSTADGVALRRTFTDIPLSRAIFDAYQRRVSGEMNPREIKRQKLQGIIPFFESRYKFTDRILLKHKRKDGTRQIFEYAAGLTPRSLILGANNLDARCVELDLPDKIGQKRLVVDELVSRGIIKKPSNVWFEEGNVTDMVSLSTASRHFRNEPIAIINEGLNRYLSMFERHVMAGHNFRLLRHFGGVWIMPDVPTKAGMAAIRKMRDLVTDEIQGREAQMEIDLDFKMSEHYFDHINDAVEFYHSFGFLVESHSLGEPEEIDILSSPKNLGLDIDSVREMLLSLHALILVV